MAMLRAALAALPKVELHCHIEGTMRPDTLVDLARHNSVRCGQSLGDIVAGLAEGLAAGSTTASRSSTMRSWSTSNIRIANCFDRLEHHVIRRCGPRGCWPR